MDDGRSRVSDRPRVTPGLATCIILGTLVLTLPRFAHTTPDSIYYTDLVEYFRGAIPRDALHTPFAFRWIVPLIAAHIPRTSPAVAIAMFAVASTIISYLVLARVFARLLVSRRQHNLAVGLLIISFPTANYGSAVMTDAVGFLVLAIGSLALLEGRFFLLALVLAMGTGVRESTLLMLPATWLFLYLQPRPRWVVTAVLVTLTTLAAAVATRWAFSDLPDYFWVPTASRFLDNMARPISWATVLLTIAPLVLLWVTSPRPRSPMPPRLFAFVIALGIPAMALVTYSVLTAFMSGRFCWPLYLPLVPLIAWRWGYDGDRTSVSSPGEA